MAELSTRQLCLALCVSLAASLGFERSARAQIPVFAPEETAEAASPEAPPSAPAEPPASVEPAPAATPPPLAPAQQAPGLRPPGSVQPAKAAVITARPPDGDVRDDVEEVVLRPQRLPRWYGWQTLIADGSSLTAILVASTLEQAGAEDVSSSFSVLGLLGYEFAPGILHFVHRNPGRGFASMGIRLGMPLAGAILGATLASGCDSNRCEEGGAGLGLLLGMGGAMAIDAAVFAYEDPKHPDRRFGLRPMLSVTPSAAWLGLGGSL